MFFSTLTSTPLTSRIASPTLSSPCLSMHPPARILAMTTYLPKRDAKKNWRNSKRNSKIVKKDVNTSEQPHLWWNICREEIQISAEKRFKYLLRNYSNIWTEMIQISAEKRFKYLLRNYSNIWTEMIQISAEKRFKYLLRNYSNIWTEMIQISAEKLFKYLERRDSNIWREMIQISAEKRFKYLQRRDSKIVRKLANNHING